jgi:hypothetical protein
MQRIRPKKAPRTPNTIFSFPLHITQYWAPRCKFLQRHIRCIGPLTGKKATPNGLEVISIPKPGTFGHSKKSRYIAQPPPKINSFHQKIDLKSRYSSKRRKSRHIAQVPGKIVFLQTCPIRKIDREIMSRGLAGTIIIMILRILRSLVYCT